MASNKATTEEFGATFTPTKKVRLVNASELYLKGKRYTHKSPAFKVSLDDFTLYKDYLREVSE